MANSTTATSVRDVNTRLVREGRVEFAMMDGLFSLFMLDSRRVVLCNRPICLVASKRFVVWYIYVSTALD